MTQDEIDYIAIISVHYGSDFIPQSYNGTEHTEVKRLSHPNSWHQSVSNLCCHWMRYHLLTGEEFEDNKLGTRTIVIARNVQPVVQMEPLVQIDLNNAVVTINHSSSWRSLSTILNNDITTFIQYLCSMLVILEQWYAVEYSVKRASNTDDAKAADSVTTVGTDNNSVILETKPVLKDTIIASINAVLNHLMNLVTLERSRATCDETNKSLNRIRHQVSYTIEYINELFGEKH